MLIVNPFATATSPAGRDALTHTLSAQFQVDVEQTTHRGHANELGARARTEGFDAVVVHGGDGSVNEAVNGLLGPPGADSRQPPTGGYDGPALAVIPGGSANVFARTLGIDPDPLRATQQMITLLSEQRCRTIGLGHTDDRWFLFNVGMGMDAIVVRAMEDKRHAGKAATPSRYLWTTFASFVRHSRTPSSFTIDLPDRESVTGVRFGFVSNSTPWTFLGKREIRTNPQTGFNERLGVFAATSTGVIRNTPLALRMLTGREPKARHLIRDDDVAWAHFHAEEPLDVQMDGDYIGQLTGVRFGHRADVLRVASPR